MTRRKSRPDLDTFHAHLDALKLSFIREHYPDVVRRAAEEQSDHLSVLEPARTHRGRGQLATRPFH